MKLISYGQFVSHSESVYQRYYGGSIMGDTVDE